MIEKNVIMAVLSGIAITGVIPIVAGLVLLAVHKIKASSFWAGVLAFVIAFVAFAIVSAVVSVAAVMTSGNMQEMMSGEAEMSTSAVIVLTVIMAVLFMLSMSICIGSCMKNTRTFVGAVSCGLGFGISYMVTTAFSFFSLYTTFVQVNSGEFDKLYSTYIDMGVMNKEQINALKESFTSYTVADILIEIVSSLAVGAVFVAAAVFIMRGACVKKLFAGTAAAFAAFTVQNVASIIPNAVAGAVIAIAIGAAALIFALRMREKVVPPPKPSYSSDSFMQSIESAKQDSFETDTK